MSELIVFWLSVLGCTYIVTQSSIGSPVRRVMSRLLGRFRVLMYCPACFSFWVGLVFWLLGARHGLRAYEAALSSCALGALWSEWGSSLSPWQAETGEPSVKTEKATNG